MRRGFGIVVLMLVVLAGIAIGVGAYNAGVSHGLAEAANGGQVVHVVGPGYGFGFFPFGLFLFPLFLFGIFALFRFAFWGRRWGGYGPGGADHGHGPWRGGWNQGAEDWHRRQHEPTSGDHTPSGGEPASG